MARIRLYSIWAIALLGVLMLGDGIREAKATGGAYLSTKHGGWNVDNVLAGAPAGVDRAIGGEVAFYYDLSGAGQYAPGECNHCHDIHNNFGGFGSVPPPEGNPPDTSTGSPDLYLLFGDSAPTTNKNEFCWYCHENMILGSPPQPVGYGYYGFYQGKANFTASSHGSSSSFVWPGDSNLAGADAWPRSTPTSGVNGARPSGDVNKCINCHTPHGIAGNYDADGTAPAAGDTIYRVRTASFAATDIIPRQLIAREEALCLNCHDGSPAVATGNIKAQLDYDLSASGSGHPVRETTYYGRHTQTENTIGAGWFANNQHAECVDCHNPHTVKGKGTGMTDGTVFQPSGVTSFNNDRYDTAADSSSSAVKLGSVNTGVWGISINTSTGAYVSTIDLLTTTDRVYNLCLKCHSYWAWGGANVNTPTGTAVAPLWNAPSSTKTFGLSPTPNAARANLSFTNLAWEFATDGIAPTTSAWTPAAGRVAYHPVFAIGRNRPELYTQEFAGGVRNLYWCAGTAIASYATQGAYGDGLCAAGGGDVGGTGPAIGARADTAGTAFEATLSQNFVPPWRHTSMITCVDCHESETENDPRGPHGSANPYILRKLDKTISYSRCATANCATTNTYSYAAITDNNNFCLNCHRADVYGYVGTLGIYTNFARQPHNSFRGGEPFTINNPTTAPNGIVCMICHAGNQNKLGSIHGNDYTSTRAGSAGNNPPTGADICPNCTTAGRLLSTTGVAADSGEWGYWVKSTVGTPGGHTKLASPYCGNTQNGPYDVGAGYNY